MLRNWGKYGKLVFRCGREVRAFRVYCFVLERCLKRFCEVCVAVNIQWQWSRIEDLATKQWHHIVSLRQAVFVVEQNCPYLDADDLDLYAWHLIGWGEAQDSDGTEIEGKKCESIAVAYLRVVDPGCKYSEPSIGRVLTRISHRRGGLGKAVMIQAMKRISEQFPQQAIRISAQEHLHKFYSEFGFTQTGEGYDEDGIPHIEMLKSID